MNQRLKLYLSIALVVPLLGAWLLIVDINQVIKICKNIESDFIIPLVLLFLLMYFLRSLRWKIILSPIEHITLFESFNLCMVNYFVNFLVPVHAGEAIKSLLLKRLKGTPISKSILTAYIDKIADLIPIFLLLLALPFVEIRTSKTIYLASGASLIILAILLAFLFTLARRGSIFVVFIDRKSFFLPPKLRAKFKSFLKVFEKCLSSIPSLSGNLFLITALTCLALIVHCLFLWLFFFSFGIDLPLLTVLVSYLLLNASFILPAPPGFSGSLELTFIFIFTYLFGYDRNVVSAVAAFSHVFVSILFGLCGFIGLSLIGVKISTILGVDSKSTTSL